MVESAFYLVTKDVAMRSGVIKERYRIKDGRFVLDNKDLARIRFRPDEYIDGLKGVEKVDIQTAKRLIAENGYQMGVETSNVGNDVAEETNNETNENEEE